ncbi:hypothetical protein [Paraburkholderia humisilvae]|uniref:hypothetical protein n=1 Tax=Paraburkholderia humisilvae TaxID=627669 RepID=UPI0015818D8D|nr:hypothetical protein [Paraburkholderia humisilvae]
MAFGFICASRRTRSCEDTRLVEFAQLAASVNKPDLVQVARWKIGVRVELPLLSVDYPLRKRAMSRCSAYRLEELNTLIERASTALGNHEVGMPDIMYGPASPQGATTTALQEKREWVPLASVSLDEIVKEVIARNITHASEYSAR